MKTTKNTTQTIGKIKGSEIVTKSGGKHLEVTFGKKNNEIRTLSCRLASNQSGLKGIGMARVYDFKDRTFKTVNLQTLTKVTKGNVTYLVK